MKEGPDISRIAALIGDPARANMLTGLMAGPALTAGELSAEAGITPQTASAHLAKLVEAGLLSAVAQGRHRYFTLATPEVARLIEALMGLATGTAHRPPTRRPGPKDESLRAARSCYHHLAGAAGVRLHDSLTHAGHLAQDASGLHLTATGAAYLAGLGLYLPAAPPARCRSCLDWSERRFHLGGTIGRAILQHMLAARWLHPIPASRAVRFTGPGQRLFAAAFPLPGRATNGVEQTFPEP